MCTRPVTGHTTTRLITRPLIVRTLSGSPFPFLAMLPLCLLVFPFSRFVHLTHGPPLDKKAFPVTVCLKGFPFVCGAWVYTSLAHRSLALTRVSCPIDSLSQALWSHSLEPSRFPLNTVCRPLKQTIAFLPYHREDCYLCVCSVPYGPSLWSDYLIMVQFYATQAIAPFFLLFPFNDTQSIDFGPLQIC